MEVYNLYNGIVSIQMYINVIRKGDSTMLNTQTTIMCAILPLITKGDVIFADKPFITEGKIGSAIGWIIGGCMAFLIYKLVRFAFKDDKEDGGK